jgi:hypothetical protein
MCEEALNMGEEIKLSDRGWSFPRDCGWQGNRYPWAERSRGITSQETALRSPLEQKYDAQGNEKGTEAHGSATPIHLHRLS